MTEVIPSNQEPSSPAENSEEPKDKGGIAADAASEGAQIKN
jgi:hypothetical protein